jgi:hypothetical protein
MRGLNRSTVAFVTIVTIASIGAVGCKSSDPAVKRSEQAADDLLNARQQLAASDRIVADAQMTLRTLSQSKADLRPPFEAFVSNIEIVRKQAERQSSSGEAVQARANEYCTARQQDVATISNTDLRKTAESRLAQMQKQSQSIKDGYAKMNAAFAAYIRNLTDIQTYLANDLNYSALAPAQGPITQALASGDQLRSLLRDLAGQVELMSNTLSPSPLPSSQWPSTAPATTAEGR